MYQDCPELLRNYLFYLETIKGRSKTTVQGYHIDLRMLLRFLKKHKKLVAASIPLEEIKIEDISVELLQDTTLSDIYEFLHFTLTRCGNQAKTRARKVSSIRGFFKYLTNHAMVLSANPVLNLEMPSTKKALPKYLTLENCYTLLKNLDSKQIERDFCALVLFLNCGMRLSELVGINHYDIRENQLLLRGKGNKERIVYLNQACLDSIAIYQQKTATQFHDKPHDRDALFLSSRGNRISKRQVQRIVEQALNQAGLGHNGYSPHKLRHTAATMMYQQGGVDIRVLQEVLGHANLGTTQIYTHVASSQLEEATANHPLASVKPSKKNT